MRLIVVLLVIGCGGTDGGSIDGASSCPEPRSCTMASLTGTVRPTSTMCVDGTQVPDRTCPVGSECASGYCTVSTSAMLCTSDNDCSSTVGCAPFLIQGAAQTYCAGFIGSKLSGEACISDLECRSGICIPGRGTCFGACPVAGQPCNSATTCEAVQIVIEGTQVTLPSCVR